MPPDRQRIHSRGESMGRTAAVFSASNIQNGVWNTEARKSNSRRNLANVGGDPAQQRAVHRCSFPHESCLEQNHVIHLIQ
ncbi:hypothetical protein TNCV_318401 [Trichonephila clavipes]|nr:hypothetical protein TNCV_318401 [Trichonephila clavipes]